MPDQLLCHVGCRNMFFLFIGLLRQQPESLAFKGADFGQCISIDAQEPCTEVKRNTMAKFSGDC